MPRPATGGWLLTAGGLLGYLPFAQLVELAKSLDTEQRRAAEEGLSEDELAVRVSGLERSFGERIVLSGVDLDIQPGEFVALLGRPNAGKSTLLACISAARPKIAPYPFTTLVPQLGIVRLRNDRSCVVADIPGLIEGAHHGKGLGHQFLRHIERTRLLLHLVDMTSPEPDDPLIHFETVNRELFAYAPHLAEKPQVVVATKMDVPSAKQAWECFQPAIAALGLPVYAISAVTGEGIGALIDEIDKAIIPVRSVSQSNRSRERTL